MFGPFVSPELPPVPERGVVGFEAGTTNAILGARDDIAADVGMAEPPVAKPAVGDGDRVDVGTVAVGVAIAAGTRVAGSGVAVIGAGLEDATVGTVIGAALVLAAVGARVQVGGSGVLVRVAGAELAVTAAGPKRSVPPLVSILSRT